ncbi:MAG: EAL domain-containing protein [Clostridiaceae bacterium]|nr:EAL domain-containing protein [Clostridiaceae bacterium]
MIFIGKDLLKKLKLKRNNLGDLRKSYRHLEENIIYSQKITRIGSWTYDIQKDEIFFTNEVYGILGCGPEEIGGKLENYYSFVHPEYLHEVRKAMEEALCGKECSIKFRIIAKNGMGKYVHKRNKVIYDEKNRPIRIVGIIKDITDQKLREEHIKKIGDNFSQALRLAGVASWKYDVVEDEFYGSDEMFTIFGIERLGFDNDFNNVIKLVHPDDQYIVQEAMQKYLAGQSCAVEFRILQQDGTNKYVIGKAEPVFDAEGRVINIIGTLQDITKYKLLEQELKRSYKIINQAQALARIGSWEADIVNNKIYWSDEACRIFGFSSNTSCETIEDFKKYVYPEDAKAIDDMLANPANKPIELEFRIIRQDGSVRNLYELVEFIFDKEGNPIRIYGTVQDITDKKELEKEAELKQEKINKIQKRFDALVKESIDIFEILDSEGRILYISKGSEKITGYKPEERIGRKIYEFYEKPEAQKLAKIIEIVLKNPEKKVKTDILFKAKDGRDIYLEFYMRKFLHDPAVEGIVVNFRDITDRIKNQQRIAYLSTHDQLTGLPNKLCFEKKYKMLLKKAKEDGTEFAIFMLDIDSLAYMKNTLGQELAEQYITRIAVKLKLYCGTENFLCRYCDDRFAIIIVGKHTISEYETIIKDIFDLFSQTIKVDKYELDVDISMGISIYQKDGEENELLVRNSETALFLAKNEGKNRYRFYSPDINIQSYKQFILRNDLKKAMEKDQLKIYYQPIVNLITDSILAAEALIRWEHPEWGVVSPAEFIAIAEETGCIIKIGDWLLREVCRNYKQWLNKGLPNIKISINYSTMQFLESDFVEKIKNIIDEHGLNPDFLIIEIKENMLMERTDKVITDIKRLQALGIQIALDNFGKGYSSLAYLASLNIDIIKIDGYFIKNININEKNTTIIRYIIKMAKELKIKLVAEHVETLEQLDFLRELKCYTGQGHIFSKPVPLADFEEILAKRKCTPLVTQSVKVQQDRRKFFRIKFVQLLEADLSILEIKGKKVNVGNTKVLVKNIGPGGLCFISPIRFPIIREIILQFITQLIGEEIIVYGCPVWTREIDDGLFEYGVEFTFDENKRTELIRVLNQVQIKMKNDILFADGNFVSISPNSYFKINTVVQ